MKRQRLTFVFDGATNQEIADVIKAVNLLTNHRNMHMDSWRTEEI